MSSTVAMFSLTVQGRVFGKTSSTPAGDETRAILPLCSIWALLDAIAHYFIEPFVKEWAPADNRIFVGARPRTQALEVAHACNLVVEKSLDRHSAGAVSQADILKFFDRIQIAQLAQFFVSRGSGLAIVGAFIRLHACVIVTLSCPGVRITLPSRARGLLTGSRSAVVLAQVPIDDALNVCLESWSNTGFTLTGSNLIACTWVDNFYAFGDSPRQSIDILEDLEQILVSQWNLEFGKSSKKLLIPRGNPEASSTFGEWQVVQHFPVLGHLISDNNASEQCWQLTKEALWRSFWRNSGALEGKGGTSQKLRLLQRCTHPRLQSVATRWAFTAVRAQAIDWTQRKMVSRILRIPKPTDMSIASYYRRRDQVVSQACREMGYWSTDWCTKLLNWSDHLRRPRNGHSPAARLFLEQDSVWLQLRRLPFTSTTRSLLAGGTGTRSLAEAPKKRWEGSLDAAFNWRGRSSRALLFSLYFPIITEDPQCDTLCRERESSCSK